MDKTQQLMVFAIDDKLRTITMPNNGSVFGVSGDIEVNQVEFQMPRYCAGFDMTDFTGRVNYVNPNGDSNYYESEISGTDDTVSFIWLMKPDVTRYSGDVKFSVKLYKKQDGKILKQFNTRSAVGRVLEGFDVIDSVTPEEQETLLHKIEAEIKEEVKAYIDQYAEDKVSEMTQGLPEAVNSLKEDIGNIKKNFKFKEENNMTVKAGNQITLVDITDAYSVMLTSEAYTFVGGTGGVGANQSCTTEAVAFCGNNQCSVVTVDAKSIVCPTGISAAVSNSGTSKVTIKFTTTATVNAACEATIPVSVDGITINKKFSFAVARTGNTGATGKGIKGTPVTEYVASTGNTTPPTSGWSTSIPSVAQGQYLWTRVTTTYTDNSTSVSYSVAKQGSTGATGTTGSQWYAGTGITGTSTTATAFADSGVANARVNDMYLNTSTGNTYKCTVAGNATNAKWVYAGNIKGVQGDKGNTGATGNGISKADITYASSSSNTSAPTSGWQNTPPSVSPGQYLWTKTVFTYTNGGTATQYSVAKQGNTGAAGADAITVSITSSNGTVFKNNSGSTVLTAHVYKGAVEQTVADNGTVSGLGTIKWYKVGSDTAVATAKTLTVSANDVDNTQAYTCQLEG